MKSVFPKVIEGKRSVPVHICEDFVMSHADRAPQFRQLCSLADSGTLPVFPDMTAI